MNREQHTAGETLWSDDTKLRELVSAVRVNVIVDRIWKTLFTEHERQKIAADPTMGPDIIDIWAKFRGVSPRRAVLDLARAVNLLTEAEFRRLLGSSGEETKPADSPTVPIWDRKLGQLRLDDVVVKRVHRLKAATNVVLILDAFQEVGWPTHLDDPLPPQKLRQSRAQRLEDAIKSLNRNLSQIRFRADGRGEGIVWGRV